MTLFHVLFLALDSSTDAALWPRFRAAGWPNPLYQALRFVLVRTPLLVGVLFGTRTLYELFAPPGIVGLAGFVAALFCLVLIWTAAMDTPYHWFLRLFGMSDGDLLDGEDHDDKGPILPAIASDVVGDDVMSESEYRTAAVSSGLSVLACAICVDLGLILSAIL